MEEEKEDTQIGALIHTTFQATNQFPRPVSYAKPDAVTSFKAYPTASRNAAMIRGMRKRVL